MRSGKPFVPILKQRLGEGYNGRERPGEQPSSARTSEFPVKQDAWCDVSVGRGDELPPSAPLSARSSAGSTKSAALPRQTRRPSGTNSGTRKATPRNSHGGAGSTGGTWGGTALTGSNPSPLSSFWSHIDDLDQDLQMRAAQLKGGQGPVGSRRNTPKDSIFMRTPDRCSKDGNFSQTPDPKDIIFSETPDVYLKGASFGDPVSLVGLQEGCWNAAENQEYSVAETQSNRKSSDASDWLAGLPSTTAILDSCDSQPPAVTSVLSSPDVSETNYRDTAQLSPRGMSSSSRPGPQQRSAQTQSAKRGRTPPGVGARTPKGTSNSGVFGWGRGTGRSTGDTHAEHGRRQNCQVEDLGDPHNGRQQAAKQQPRRCGSAPPARRRPVTGNPSLSMTTSAQSANVMLADSPQPTPRIMCRETRSEAEGGQKVDPGTLFFAAANGFHWTSNDDAAPSSSKFAHMAHVCHMMQMERNGFLDTLHEVCIECGIPVAGPAGGDALHVGEMNTESIERHVSSPRSLLHSLRDAHLHLREQVAASQQSKSTMEAALDTTRGTDPSSSTCADAGSSAPSNGCDQDNLSCNSLMLSATPASPVDRLLDSPWTASASQTGTCCKGTANAIIDGPQSLPARPFAEAAAALRFVLENRSGTSALLASLSSEAHSDLKELARHIVDLKVAEPTLMLPALSGDSVLSSASCEAHASPVVLAAAVSSETASSSVQTSGHQALSSGSPQSSFGSLPGASGRLCELVEEKRREVSELQERCERAASNEEQLEADTLLAAAREELRLLREFLGAEAGGSEHGLSQVADAASTR